MGLIKWLGKSISENINLETNLELEQEIQLLQHGFNNLDNEIYELQERLDTSNDNYQKLANLTPIPLPTLVE